VLYAQGRKEQGRGDAGTQRWGDKGDIDQFSSQQMTNDK